MGKQGNESKPDSLASLSKEKIEVNKDDPNYRLERAIDNSVSDSLKNLNTALDKVTELLKAAESELESIPQLKGMDKLQGETAQKLLQKF